VLTTGKVEWRVELPATVEAIDGFCMDFQIWREENCVGLESFPAELLLREALANAVVHGCGEDPAKTVSCVLRARARRLFIAVRDTGDGFDWRLASGWRARANEVGGRGIEILRQYSDAIRFNSKGNAVALMKRY
jgi:anti-sigma regulatory factor (Ser/Thr protein kinase)